MTKPNPSERGEDMAAEEPKRKWGQEHSHGSTAPWGTEAGTEAITEEGDEGSHIGRDLRWGETSHEGDARGAHESGKERGNEAQGIHPGQASNEARPEEEDSKREGRSGSDDAQNSDSGS